VCVVAVLLLIALTGCGGDQQSDAASTTKPTAPASIVSPRRTLSTLDAIAYQQAVAAMKPVDGLQDGPRYTALQLVHAFTGAAEKIRRTVDATTDLAVKEALVKLAAADRVAGQRADADGSGMLEELADEIEVVQIAQSVLATACEP
jgi:hypothetical protein